jgi:RimJ/RimL family protein N-acetyltransferase
MKHDIHIDGYGFSMRPVEMEDAQFIVDVRTPDRSRFMNDIDRTIEAQQAWLQDYFQSPQMYYFVVERNKDRRPEGLARLLDFDDANLSVQWGSLILRPGSLAASETALLILTLAFDKFGVEEVWGVPLKSNKRMIAYIEALGFEQREIVPVPFDGQVVDGTRHVLTKDRWRNFENKVRENARNIADRF